MATGGYLGDLIGGVLVDDHCQDAGNTLGDLIRAIGCVINIVFESISIGTLAGAILGAWSSTVIIRKFRRIRANLGMALVGSLLLGSVTSGAILALFAGLGGIDDDPDQVLFWFTLVILSILIALACSIGALIGSKIGSRGASPE